MAITIEESKLLAIFIQTLLYGAYVILFVMTCWHFHNYVRPRHHACDNELYTHRPRICVLALAPGGPGSFFEIFAEFTQMFGSTLYIAQTLVGDSILLYRCYVVWGNQFRVIAFPAFLLSGSTVTGIGILYSFSRIVPGSDIFVPSSGALLAFRIWHATRSTTTFPSRGLRPALRLVIESGAIYSVTLITLLVLFKANSWFQYVLIDAISPIVGLVFSTIIVRVGLGLTAVTEERAFPYGVYNSENDFRARSQQKNLTQLEPFEAAPNHMSAVGITVDTKTTSRTYTEEDLKIGSGTEGGQSSLDELEKQIGQNKQ
ncbi:hypothetical protein BD779DRAFT_1668362 [Infundibulicybe gibba]|nr:hypothetical protein BD779DRAFT_1668362 [Infundibulicybe gibba]